MYFVIDYFLYRTTRNKKKFIYESQDLENILVKLNRLNCVHSYITFRLRPRKAEKNCQVYSGIESSSEQDAF